MFEVLWHLGQTTNVIDRITAQFVIMCPYCAHMCILRCLTMLQEEVFFSSHEKAIFYFRGAENGVFCEATTKLKFHIGTNTFFKNTRPHYMDNFPTGVS